MMKRTVYCFLMVLFLSSPAFGLDIDLKRCSKLPEEVTDIEFIFPNYAFVTTRQGDIYWFRGCGEPLSKITKLNVSDDSWVLGLYSIAVSPDFFKDPAVFVYYSADRDGQLVTRLSALVIDHSELFNDSEDMLVYDEFHDRYMLNRDALVTERVLLEIDQPHENSNGGALRFGPDELLYLGVGDGGAEGDPEGNAQNVSTIYGSILRIQPDLSKEEGYTIPEGNLQDFISGAVPEIWAYGVRNPWQITFDSQDNMIIADVGEHTIEEVDIIPAEMIGTEIVNLGWNIKEGNNCFNPPAECDSEGLIDPVFQYEHSGGEGNSITGGETLFYKGDEYYIFGDFMTGMLGVLDLDDPSDPVFEDGIDGNWVAFAKDPIGRVYVVDYYGGNLYKVDLD
jgi:hypothetical protein